MADIWVSTYNAMFNVFSDPPLCRVYIVAENPKLATKIMNLPLFGRQLYPFYV